MFVECRPQIVWSSARSEMLGLFTASIPLQTELHRRPLPLCNHHAPSGAWEAC